MAINKDKIDTQTHILSEKSLQSTGLLYFINTTVLWPLGLALYVEIDPNGRSSAVKLGMMSIEPPQPVADGSLDELDHPRERAKVWIESRLEAMSEADRALSLEVLRDPLNIAAFLGAADIV